MRTTTKASASRLRRLGIVLASITAGVLVMAAPASADTITTSTGSATNTSGGTAVIVTRPATAVGNASNTTTVQSATVSGGGVVIVHQSRTVTNFGIANLNTGGNTATGNHSTNITLTP